MTGTVELDRDGANLLIRFPYREDLVALVKSVPGRRWDPKQKTWRVPAASVEVVYTTFSRHLFSFAPEVSSLLAGTLGTPKPAQGPSDRSRDGEGDGAVAGGAGAGPGGDGAEAEANGSSKSRTPPAGQPTLFPAPQSARAPAAEPAEPPSPASALSVSALNQRVRNAIAERFEEAVWVVGEIVDFDKSAGREHRFFQLAEKAAGQSRPRAVVAVALFERTAQRLLAKLGQGEDALSLRDGLEVRLLVKVDLYVASGRYQVVVEDVDPTFTLGKLALSREQILRELRTAGLAERNKALPVPKPALRIGVLASETSDGFHDFLSHVERSGVGFELTFVPIKVQGYETKPSLLAGLHWFAQREERFDVVCILRGGGSKSDLAWFDDRDLAYAVARHPLKVLVGIGHQRDRSVLDELAHSEKTPTAVADFLVRCAEEAREELADRVRELAVAVRAALAKAGTELARRGRDLALAVDGRLQRERQQLASAGRKAESCLLLRLRCDQDELRSRAARVASGAERRLERAAARLAHQATKQRLLDPARVVARGYALVRGADGKIATSAARIAKGSAFAVRMRDGEIRGTAEDVRLERRP